MAYQKVKRHSKCAYCGTEYEHVRPESRYCSESCWAKDRRRKAKVPASAKCKHCGSEFEACHSSHLYCSRKCSDEARAKTVVVATCKQCLSDFEKPSTSGRVYCCDKCFSDHRREQELARYYRNKPKRTEELQTVVRKGCFRIMRIV